MHTLQEKMHPAISKLVRMTLVFLLVFWSSFSVETLVAFGDDKSSGAAASSSAASPAPDDGDEDTPGEGGGGNTGDDPDDPVVIQDPDDPGTDNPGTDNPGTDNPGADNPGTDDPGTDNPQPEQPKESDRYNADKHDDGTLTNLEIWKLASDGAANVESQVGSATGTAQGADQSIKLSSNNGELILAAVPHWQGDTYNKDNPPSAGNANFVEWSVSGDTDSVKIVEDKGRLKLTGQSKGDVKVTLKLKKDVASLVDPNFASTYPNKAFETTITVNVVKPFIRSMEILKSNGEPCLTDQALQLSADELKSYAFQVKVNTGDLASDQTGEFVIGNGKNLKEVSGGLFEDVKWEVLDKDRNPAAASVATITQDGVFKMVGDLEKEQSVIVRCVSNQGENDTPVTPEVRIGTMPKADKQGESHPQESLHVVSNAAVASEGGEVPGEGAQDGTANNPANPTDPATSGQAADLDGDGVPDTSAGAAQVQTIDKTYNASQLSQLGSTTGTYSMRNSEGALTVTGEGPSLTAILTDAGITDFSQVLTVEFVDYRGVSTSVAWAELEAAAPLMAIKSYVHDDEKTDASATDKSSGAAAPAGQLLNNTQFRLIGTGISADADSLRYINEIRVHLAAGEGKADPTDSELEVKVDYVPVPKGDTAVLSAVVNQAIGTATFLFQWQTSADGVNWTDVPGGAVQTLRVITNDDTIGKRYRVLLTTNMLDAEGKERATVSDPVQIKEGNGFFVALDYDPPIAGETAIFQAIVKDTENKVDISKVEYVWEQSNDGGLSWSTIPNAKSSMLSIPTKPVTKQNADASNTGDTGENAEGGESAEQQPAKLIYIRVRAIAPDGRVAVSNAQPLTAHPGGEGQDPEGGDKPGTITLEDPEEATAPELPKNETQNNTAQDPDSDKKTPTEQQDPVENSDTPKDETKPKKTVTLNEIPSIVSDNTPRQVPSTTGGTPTAPQTTSPEKQETQTQIEQQSPSTSNSGETAPTQETPSELVINPEISALIQDQQKTVDRALETSRPGARWTKINTVDPTSDQVKNILADNPFAPFVVPLGLGVVVAGGVEKFLAFRRQKRK